MDQCIGKDIKADEN
ncbi:hypothetical protein OCT59_023535 [Rhizophagus irregularis]|nr:hypothetical protein OCT59_023535 [Rhizophagus irregularis]